MQTFMATVRMIGINPYVRVPAAIVRKLHQDAKRQAGPIPVKGKLQGKGFSATVVRFSGMWRLYLNTAMRVAARVEVGDKVTVGIRVDRTPRSEPFPRKLTLAFSKSKAACEAFEKLAPSRQKEILRYLNSLKQQETLDRNVAKVIQFLHGKTAHGPVSHRVNMSGPRKP